MKNVVKIEWG